MLKNVRLLAPETCCGTPFEEVRHKLKGLGPGVAGALFGAGWWFFVDAVAASSKAGAAGAGSSIPWTQYVPGIVATVAMLMINTVSRNDVNNGYEAMDVGTECRTKFWLLLAYLVSLGSVIGSVVNLIQHYATNPLAKTVWPGVAGLLQCILVLASGLVFYLTRASGGDSGDYF